MGSVEVGQQEDVEKLGAGSRAEGVEAGTESALQLVGSHARRLRIPFGLDAQAVTTSAEICDECQEPQHKRDGKK